jgi:hypothetical protein
MSPLGTEVEKIAAQLRLGSDVRMGGGAFKGGGARFSRSAPRLPEKEIAMRGGLPQTRAPLRAALEVSLRKPPPHSRPVGKSVQNLCST